MDIFQQSILKHKEHQGKIRIESRMPLETAQDLSLAYTPGVAGPCQAIAQNKDRVYDYTSKGNMVAIVTDGSAVLGLGDIGPQASLPVMEGKALLFKRFAGVDAFPLCLDSRDVDEIVSIITALSPGFGGINIEDIAAPACFEIEDRLVKALDIPVFHDDQHGTAVVTLAALINALRLVDKKMEDIRVVISGAGAAGISIARLLRRQGVQHLLVCDSKGILSHSRKEPMNAYKTALARETNPDGRTGSLAQALVGADLFIGVSRAGLVSQEMVASMANQAIVMAMANPDPEIDPALAKAAGARVVCTGRSDYPNQVNNVLAFPGIFRGALDVRAGAINEAMKLAAAQAIADMIPYEDLREDYVIPDAFLANIGYEVGKRVAQAAKDSGLAQKK